MWLPSQGADHKPLSLQTESFRAPILSTHSEDTAVHVTSEHPSQRDASLTVLIGIQCHMMKANNYQGCWKGKDHITLDKANILAVNLYTLRNIILQHGFLYRFPLYKMTGCVHIRFWILLNFKIYPFKFWYLNDSYHVSILNILNFLTTFPSNEIRHLYIGCIWCITTKKMLNLLR